MAYLSGIRPFAVYVVGTDILKAKKITKNKPNCIIKASSFCKWRISCHKNT